MAANLMAQGGANLLLRRLREAEREQGILVCMIVACFVALPLEALNVVKLPLYGVAFTLNLLLLMVESVALKTEKYGFGMRLVGCILFIYLGFCWLAHRDDGAERLIQTGLFITTLVSFSEYEWTAARTLQLRRVFGFILLASSIYWFVSGRATNYYQAFYGHGNGFANVMLCALAVEALVVATRTETGDKRVGVLDAIYVAVCLILLVFANSRSALVAVAAMLLSCALFAVVGKRREVPKLATMLFLAAVALVLAFSVVYPSLYNTPLGNQLELLSREFLNKNFFSGREVVWKAVLDAIQGNELFGLGLSMDPAMIYNTTFSSHNLYLQTMLQCGVIGLGLILIILYLVVRELSASRCAGAHVGVALVLGVLVHECFEVTLTQNNFSFGIMYWALFGISLSICSRTRREMPRLMVEEQYVKETGFNETL